MTDEHLTQQEKLEKRRQQLAKWKLKKASADASPSPEVPSPGIKDATEKAASPSIELSEVERKKLERQRKLEEWKRRKQRASQAEHVEGVRAKTEEEGAGKDRSLRKEDLQKQRSPLPQGVRRPQLRIASWNKKKPNGEQQTGMERAGGLVTHKSADHKRKNVFMTQDDEQGGSHEGPRFKIPAVAKSIYNRTESVKVDKENADSQQDELDMFLETLETTDDTDNLGNDGSSGTNDASIGSIPGHVEESEDEDLSGDEDEKLISTKMKRLQNKKELSKIDHSVVHYMPFQKSFYVETPSVKALSDEEVKALRLEMDGIKVTGRNVPHPIWSWSHLGLSSLVTSIMQDKLGYNKPTSIQSQALPAIMSGRDFLGIAKTGSGKTLAFVLPLLSHVQAQPPLAKGDGPIALLLTPTRELALQIYKQLSFFTKKLEISACCCYGGSSIEPQIAELKKGSQVIVATPGRLIDLLAANNGRVCNLQRVTYVVLDEADRMFDFGFEPQVNKIFSQIRPDRQSILFSATFAKKMEALARSILHDAVEVVVGGISVVAPEISQKIEYFDVSANDSPETISQRKFDKLLELLQGHPKIKKLIFVEKQDSADELLVKLLAKGIPCVTVHGGKEQIDRKYAVREFSSKETDIDVLIATSVAARGLDVKGLDLVINYDPANHMEDYVHRVGRTGRAGNKGDAYTFVTSEQERPITDLVRALRLSKIPDGEIDPRLIAISDQFLGKVKDGKEKFRFGFGGNGLNKLDEARNMNKAMERKAYDVEGAPAPKSATPVPNELRESKDNAIDLPEFNVVEGRAEETAGPDKCKFHSRITINDLPQKARWAVVNADNLASIIEATSTSITNKGQYYPANTKVPETIKQGGRTVPAPPKLYLLIEGLSESSVSEANRMIRQKMIEGLEQASQDDNASTHGKYSL